MKEVREGRIRGARGGERGVTEVSAWVRASP